MDTTAWTLHTGTYYLHCFGCADWAGTSRIIVNANVKTKRDIVDESAMTPAALTQLISWCIQYFTDYFLGGNKIGEEIRLPMVIVNPVFRKKMS
jgi:hypothetical protein